MSVIDIIFRPPISRPLIDAYNKKMKNYTSLHKYKSRNSVLIKNSQLPLFNLRILRIFCLAFFIVMTNKRNLSLKQTEFNTDINQRTQNDNKNWCHSLNAIMIYISNINFTFYEDKWIHIDSSSLNFETLQAQT